MSEKKYRAAIIGLGFIGAADQTRAQAGRNQDPGVFLAVGL